MREVPGNGGSGSTRDAETRAGVLSRDVLKLLELRESEAVAPWLVARLESLLEASEARVLRVYPLSAARRRDQAGHQPFAAADFDHGEPAPVDDDALLLDSIRSQRVVSDDAQAGRARLLVPLFAAYETRYVIDLAGVKRDAVREETLELLLPIVVRYFDLLIDAETDPLTRLSNRRVFQSQMETGIPAWADGARTHFLAMVDIDHFKRVNDRFGHLYGDEILVRFAQQMQTAFRAGDFLYRFGGEEFVVVFGVDRPEDGEKALERFRQSIEQYDFPGIGRVTVSAGYTRITDPAAVTNYYIDRSDQALYYAKANGRNRVCEYERLLREGALVAPSQDGGGETTLF